MFLKDFCKEGRCAESRPLAICVVHSTCARLLAGIFKYSELTLQSRFFSQSLERAVKEKVVGRVPTHVQNPDLVQNLEGKDRIQTAGKNTMTFLMCKTSLRVITETVPFGL